MRLGAAWLAFECLRQKKEKKSFRVIFALSSHKCWASFKKGKKNREFYHGKNFLLHEISSCQWEKLTFPPRSVLWLLFLPLQSLPASPRCSLLPNFLIMFLLSFPLIWRCKNTS